MSSPMPKCKITVIKRTLNQDLIDEYIEYRLKDIEACNIFKEVLCAWRTLSLDHSKIIRITKISYQMSVYCQIDVPFLQELIMLSCIFKGVIKYLLKFFLNFSHILRFWKMVKKHPSGNLFVGFISFNGSIYKAVFVSYKWEKIQYVMHRTAWIVSHFNIQRW